jgi:hypothetical protein
MSKKLDISGLLSRCHGDPADLVWLARAACPPLPPMK